MTLTLLDLIFTVTKNPSLIEYLGNFPSVNMPIHILNLGEECKASMNMEILEVDLQSNIIELEVKHIHK